MVVAEVRRIALVLAALGLALALPGVAKAQAPAESIQVLSTTVRDDGTVEMVVAIPPAYGEVPALPQFFGVTESGESRTATVTDLQSSVDIVVAIDTSGSMRGQAITAARSAASAFVSQLPADARVGIIGFGATPTVFAELGTDRATQLDMITGLGAAGETSLWDALTSSASLLAPSPSEYRYVVILSDGADTVSVTDQASAITALQGAGATIYAVALQTSESSDAGLSETVAQVGGQFLATSDAAGLGPLYQEIAGRLTSRYLIEFTPSGSGEQLVIVSVAAADGSLATAQTTIDLGAAPATGTPLALSTAEIPAELGAVAAADPGLFGNRWIYFAGIAAMFGALICVASLLSIPNVRSLDIRALSPSDAGGAFSNLNQRLSRSVDSMIKDRDDTKSFDLTLDSAGLDIRPGEFVVLFTVALAVVGLFGSLYGGSFAGAAFSVVLAVAVLGYVSFRTARRRAAFADQLIDTLTILTGSLRSGRGIPQAIELVAQESASPTREEFRRVVVESRVGRDSIASLESVGDRMANQDVQWIAQAIAINRELGGDLVEVLENVAETIRSRTRIRRQVRALSAEGRISGWIMVSLPVLMFVYMRAVNPRYIALLTDTTSGRTAIGVGILLMAAGAFWIRKLVNLKY